MRIFHYACGVLIVVMISGCSWTKTQRTAEVVDPFLPTKTVAASAAPSTDGPLQPLPPVRLVSFESVESEPIPQSDAPLLGGDGLQPPATTTPLSSGLRPQDSSLPNVYPIDLSNALGLGGADNLQVRLARTRLFQAQARHFAAKTLWLPSLRLGIGYNKHDGRLQQTEGDVLEINRNSTFVGGGLGLGSTPLPGGAGGPPRLFVTLSLADAAFAPLAACQEVAAHGAAERTAQNDALADIAVAYHTLVEAQGRLANARFTQSLADRLVEQIGSFEREGFSSKTEISRARAESAAAQRRVADAQRQAVVASAGLARILRLPPQVQLVPAEDVPVPIDIVDATASADFLVAQALGNRPELAHLAARREAACWRVQHEKWRPWIPNVQVAASGGEFGGAPGSRYLNGGSRSDVDLLAVWEMQNLGLGNVALQRQRRGELHERVLELEQQRDSIAAEVVAAAADVASFREQIEIARSAIAEAQQSYELNDLRIRESEGLPIELLQSISALAEAQNAYNESVANYNRAQHRLQRAVGTPAG